jgi:acetoin utilization protein AcuC
MAAIRERLILPAVAAFAPDAIVLQCGADAVEEDPLSRLSLSNNAHWDCAAWVDVAGLSAASGAGRRGLQPLVGRAALDRGLGDAERHEIPERLPKEGEEVLRALRWDRARAGRAPPEHWFTTLRDTPRPGPVRPRSRPASPCCGDGPRRAAAFPIF